MNSPGGIRRAWTAVGLLAVLVGVGFPATCHGFFFFAWSGELNQQPTTLIPSDTDVSANPPSARSNTISREPPERPGSELPPDEQIPLVPEPTSLVAATIGLGVVSAATVRRCRRRQV